MRRVWMAGLERRVAVGQSTSTPLRDSPPAARIRPQSTGALDLIRWKLLLRPTIVEAKSALPGAESQTRGRRRLSWILPPRELRELVVLVADVLHQVL